MDRFAKKTVIVTGACGTVGAELVSQLVSSEAERVICLDNNESELFFLLERHRSSGKVDGYLADVRDVEALNLRFRKADIILHAAALKHVGICEDSPSQAVQTNILGTQNVIDAALRAGVERVVFTSSDKAVNPTNVMGTSKLMGERLITAAAQAHADVGTVFGSTRFGNVLGSRGSVVPLFRKQIEAGGPITLTDKRMTRFIMSLKEAAALVLNSAWLITSGEVLVTKMPVARIEDIANVMRARLTGARDIDIVEIGSKPGEKMYEELMNEEEVRRSYEYGNFFVVLSAFADLNEDLYGHLVDSPQPDRPYNSNSEIALDLKSLDRFLDEHAIV